MTAKPLQISREEQENAADRALLGGGVIGGAGFALTGAGGLLGARGGAPIRDFGRRLFFYGTPAAMATGAGLSLLEDRGLLERRTSPLNSSGPDLSETGGEPDDREKRSFANFAGSLALGAGGAGLATGVGNLGRTLGLSSGLATGAGLLFAGNDYLNRRQYSKQLGEFGVEPKWGSETLATPLKFGATNALLNAALSPNNPRAAAIRGGLMGGGIGLAQVVGQNLIQQGAYNKREKQSVARMGSGFQRPGDSRMASGSGSDGSPLSNLGGLPGAIRKAADDSQLSQVAKPKLPSATRGPAPNPFSAFSSQQRLPSSSNTMSFNLDGRKNNPMQKVTDLPSELKDIKNTSMGIPNKPKIERPKQPEGPKPPKPPKMSSLLDRFFQPTRAKTSSGLTDTERRVAAGLAGAGVSSASMVAMAPRLIEEEERLRPFANSSVDNLIRDVEAEQRVADLRYKRELSDLLERRDAMDRKYDERRFFVQQDDVNRFRNSVTHRPPRTEDEFITRRQRLEKRLGQRLQEIEKDRIRSFEDFTLRKKEIDSLRKQAFESLDAKADDIEAMRGVNAKALLRKTYAKGLGIPIALGTGAALLTNHLLRDKQSGRIDFDAFVEDTGKGAAAGAAGLTGLAVPTAIVAKRVIDDMYDVPYGTLRSEIRPALRQIGVGMAGRGAALGALFGASHALAARPKESSVGQAAAQGLKRFATLPLRLTPRPVLAGGALAAGVGIPLALSAPLRPDKRRYRMDQDTNLDAYKDRNDQLHHGSRTPALQAPGRRLGTG